MHSWIQHLVGLLARSWTATVSTMGTSSVAVLIAILTFVLPSLWTLIRNGRATVADRWSHFGASVLGGGAFVVLAWLALYSFHVIQLVYQDHLALVDKISLLLAENSAKTDLLQANEDLLQAIRSQPVVESSTTSKVKPELFMDCLWRDGSPKQLGIDIVLFLLPKNSIVIDARERPKAIRLQDGTLLTVPSTYFACSVRNYSHIPALNVHLVFSIAVSDTTDLQITHNDTALLTISSLDADATYTFLVANPGSHQITVLAPNTVTVQTPDEPNSIQVKLLLSESSQDMGSRALPGVQDPFRITSLPIAPNR